MAEASKGGWSRAATRSLANTRPCAEMIGTLSAANGETPARTCAFASSTGISAIGLALAATKGARFSARLLDERQPVDDHSAIDSLAHIVDGQGGDRSCSQGFHFDARLAFHFHSCFDLDERMLPLGREGHRDGAD